MAPTRQAVVPTGADDVVRDSSRGLICNSGERESNEDSQQEETSDAEESISMPSTLKVKLSSAVLACLVAAAVLSAGLVATNHEQCRMERSGVDMSCTLSPRVLWERVAQMLAPCNPGALPCAGNCLPSAPDSVCCVGPTGGGILCAAGDACCDGMCMLNGTGCDTHCGLGLVRCGGVCLPGVDEDVCCLGPTGAGIICGPDAECCDGICLGAGMGCAAQCAEGLMRCGGECLLAAPGDSECCLGPDGHGIICEAGAECCNGLCFAQGEMCAHQCGQGLVHCGGECLAGTSQDVCCLGPTGKGIVCDATAQCCDGLCAVNGTACSKVCAPGLIHCGGECMLGVEGDQCCLGATGHGIVCAADAICCDGTCSAPGLECAATCAPDMMHCGGECQLAAPGSECCLGSTGGGIVCDAGAQCCDGICVAAGEGCAETCRDGLFKCGGECVLGSEESDTCCTDKAGYSEICRSPDLCCDGVCRAQGTGCDTPCSPGMVSCGGECLVGFQADRCCLGPSGRGIVCEHDAECCEGLCVDKGFGCASECAKGTLKCGGVCLLAEAPGSQCCMGSLGGNGIICGPDSECCDGVCVKAGEGCDELCDAGLVPCGGECLPGHADSQCCVGPTGGGVLCGSDGMCCGGLCEVAGSPCALSG